MKTIMQLILVSSLCLLGTQAFANNHNHGWNNSYKKYNSNSYGKKQQKQYNFKWSKDAYWNKKDSWGSANNGNKWNNGYHKGGHNGWWSGKKAHSVPELDTNVAPLAGLLLSGLLAAGYERRRRKQLKTLED